MTDQHPLTDEMLEAIHKDYQEAINECDTLICLKIEFDKALRAAYDLSTKRCVDWLYGYPDAGMFPPAPEWLGEEMEKELLAQQEDN
jgi:hypothetical protein